MAQGRVSSPIHHRINRMEKRIVTIQRIGERATYPRLVRYQGNKISIIKVNDKSI